MKRFETAFHITNKGLDEFDAGEVAGDVLDVSKMTKDMYLYCDPTRKIEGDVERIDGFEGEISTYESVIHVFNDSSSQEEASEVAGDLFDGSRMEPGMTISCDPGRCVSEGLVIYRKEKHKKRRGNMKRILLKTISAVLVMAFSVVQFAADSHATHALSAWLSSDRNPMRTTRGDVASKLEPGAIGNGAPLQGLIRGDLPEEYRYPSQPFIKEMAEKVREAIILAVRMQYKNQAELPPEHLGRAEKALENLLDFERNLSRRLYLYYDYVASPEDYLLGFNYEERIGLDIGIINKLHAISPVRLAQYVYHECVPEHLKDEGFSIGIDRTDHGKIYSEVQTAIFGIEEVSALKKDLRDVLTERLKWREEHTLDMAIYEETYPANNDVIRREKERWQEVRSDMFARIRSAISKPSIHERKNMEDLTNILETNYETVRDFHAGELDFLRQLAGGLADLGEFSLAKEIVYRKINQIERYRTVTKYQLERMAIRGKDVSYAAALDGYLFDNKSVTWMKRLLNDIVYQQLEETTQRVKELIIVPGHGVYVGKSKDDTSKDDAWEGIFSGEGAYYAEHAEQAVKRAAKNPEAVVAFSGGATRETAGKRSEAESYFDIARQWGWWGSPEVEDKVLIEDGARDSMENVLFSVLRYKNKMGYFPDRVTVIGWEFKTERFNLHARAMGIPREIFYYAGVNNPEGKALEGALKGEAKKVKATIEDPLLKGEDWQKQREERNPFKDTPRSGYFGGRDFDDVINEITDDYEKRKIDEAWPTNEEKAQYEAQQFRKGLFDLLSKDRSKTFLLAIDSDIAKDKKAQMMPVYTLVNQLKSAKDADGNLLFPNLKIIRRSGSNGALMREVDAMLNRKKSNLNKENIILVCRKENIDSNIFDGLKGSSWIAGIDDKRADDGVYMPIIEAVTLASMAALNADIDTICRFYNSIAEKKVTSEALFKMIRERVIYILPKADPMDTKALKDKYELVKTIYLAA